MPLRHTIGISLAVLMISAGANAKDRDRHPPIHAHQHPHHHQSSLHHRSAARHERARAAHARGRHAAHHARLDRHHRRAAAADGEPVDALWGAVHPVRQAEIGKAAWYRLIGDRTASGEPLDAATPTAAHRTLPLDSLARVTDLDNGRSIIVKINDRGPVSRHLLIDLSPAAAQMLHMKHAGIAKVRVQPLARGPEPTERTTTALAGYYGTPDD